jgi:hypothetical protein
VQWDHACVAIHRVTVTPHVTEILIKFIKLQLSPNGRLNPVVTVGNKI